MAEHALKVANTDNKPSDKRWKATVDEGVTGANFLLTR